MPIQLAMNAPASLVTRIAPLLLTSACLSAHVVELPFDWPGSEASSTHEIAFRAGDDHLWVTGQNMHHVARVRTNGEIAYFPMPDGSGPHGILFDDAGQLWVSLEFTGEVVRLNEAAEIVETVDVRLFATGASTPINTAPHGIGLDADGETIWFTGKRTGTIGKINPDRSVEHFELPTVGSVPIYLHAGPDGNMWCTELVGNAIARITPDGVVTEFPIPTHASRPIAITPGPDGASMWFSEEAGRRVARIDMEGRITEFSIPVTQPNMILAGMAFDSEGNLWTQGYVDSFDPVPEGSDYVIKADSSIHQAEPGNLTSVPVTYFEVPSRGTVMHRITQGPDGNIWFTELATDIIGTVIITPEAPTGLALVFDPETGAILTWSGKAGESYQVEYSESLSSWQADLPNSRMRADEDQLLEFVDPTASSHTRRFYRVRSLPDD